VPLAVTEQVKCFALYTTKIYISNFYDKKQQMFCTYVTGAKYMQVGFFYVKTQIRVVNIYGYMHTVQYCVIFLAYKLSAWNYRQLNVLFSTGMLYHLHPNRQFYWNKRMYYKNNNLQGTMKTI
jgi:hypothetical protein